MGIKIIGEDGAVLHEFRSGLGAHLLYRIVIAAKFLDEPDRELVLNEHFSQFAIALRNAMPPPRLTASTPQRENDDDLIRQTYVRLMTELNEAIHLGQIPWPTWSVEDKQAFVRDVLFAPWRSSAELVQEFCEAQDFSLDRWRSVLKPQG